MSALFVAGLVVWAIGLTSLVAACCIAAAATRRGSEHIFAHAWAVWGVGALFIAAVGPLLMMIGDKP